MSVYKFYLFTGFRSFHSIPFNKHQTTELLTRTLNMLQFDAYWVILYHFIFECFFFVFLFRVSFVYLNIFRSLIFCESLLFFFCCFGFLFLQRNRHSASIQLHRQLLLLFLLLFHQINNFYSFFNFPFTFSKRVMVLLRRHSMYYSQKVPFSNRIMRISH